MDTIIAYRVNGTDVQMVLKENGEIAVFDNQERAIEYADGNALFQSGQADYQIISLDEL